MEDILGKVDELCSFLLDKRFDIILDGLISVTYLSNNEVKEDQHREQDNHDPAYPVDNVLSLAELVSLKCSKIKVTKGESECGQEVTGDLSNFGVFWFRWRGDDVEDHGEHHDENDKEQDEDLEVDDDLKNHCDNETKDLEDFHVEEGFYKTEDDGQNQNENGLRSWGTFEELEIATVESDCYMKNIQPVDTNCDEFEKSNLESLLTIIVQWNEKHNENGS